MERSLRAATVTGGPFVLTKGMLAGALRLASAPPGSQQARKERSFRLASAPPGRRQERKERSFREPSARREVVA